VAKRAISISPTSKGISITNHSYVSSAINVYVEASSGSWADFPCTFSQGSCDLDNRVFLSGGAALAGPTFPHEIGHHFGALHTFEPFVIYNYPVEPNQFDHPYDGENGWKRELVIRVTDPSKEFETPNAGYAGDLVWDTPVDCAPGENKKVFYPSSTDPFYPSCIDPANPQLGHVCASGCTFDYNTCTYTGDYLDYNQDPLTPPAIGTLGTNMMSYWSTCRDHFTQGQAQRILFYYVNQRQAQYDEPLCGNWDDEVDFWSTDSGVENVTINIDHPNDDRYCNATTNQAGDFDGIIYENTVTSDVTKLGSGPQNTFTYSDWIKGITTFDLVLITKHILGVQTFDSGYKIIAADANNSGTVTTLDVVIFRKLILQKILELEDYDQPWRFVPEYIVEDFSTAFHSDPFNMTIGGTTYNIEAPYLVADWVYSIADGNNGKSGFDAIKTGDVNGSAEPEFGPEGPGEPVLLTIEKTIVGNQAIFDFKVEGFVDIVAYQMEIEYDKELLDYLNSTGKDLSGVIEDFFAADDSVGIVRTLWYDEVSAAAHTLTDSGNIFQLVFEGDGDLTTANVQLFSETMRGARLNGAYKPKLSNFAYSKDGTIHPVIQKEIFENGIISIGVAPNPFEHSLNLNIDMVRDDYVHIEVHNAIGQLILSSKVYLEKGANTIDLGNLTRLPRGLLFVSAFNKGKTFTTKAVGL
jgi:hypothetical protein